MQSKHLQDLLDRGLGDPRKLQFELSIRTQVLQRDQIRCLFTGSLSLSTEVTWMAPPYFAYLAFPINSPREIAGLSSDDLEKPSNAILIHKLIRINGPRRA
ncbi:hypothetical protein ARMSODRAFT_963152 [Armillaria solidipes]|uniref:Uncharacterized protein n=1 Tax=Armillaria solidipes TaxID=1076256 RepID=A0A2H3BBY3_9AGAR|nr:hypothetical protein ARMSODRAFT_963152 [Armillaria solidipes]